MLFLVRANKVCLFFYPCIFHTYYVSYLSDTLRLYIYIYIKCIVTNKYASCVLEYNNTNVKKMYA